MLDRVLYEQIPYPIEYGLIPQTWDDDDDMLDIMALLTTPTFPGCLLRVRPIGVMIFCDSEVTDDKILAVAADDIRFNNIKDIKDLDPHKLDEIAFFFQYYKSLQFKYKKQYNMKVEFKGWKNREKAMEIVNKSMNLFKVKFPETQK
jgi:inorganic pyrophosphatase